MRLCIAIAIVLLAGCERRALVVGTRDLPFWQRPEVTREIDEPGKHVERFVPGDARWFVRLDGLAEWMGGDGGHDVHDGDGGDPLVEHLWAVIQSHQPPELWNRAKERLGLDDRAVLETYFGRTLALVDQKVDGRHGVVVMTRVRGDALRALPEALGLSPFGSHDRIGPFATYSGWEGEKEYLFAIGKRWLMITEAACADHLRRLLCAVAAGEDPLLENEKFAALLDQLPGRRDGVILVRDSDGDDHHALSIARKPRGLTVDYIAEAPKLHEYIRDVDEVGGVDFGPLPASVIMAVSINIMHRSIPGTGVLNLMLFPRSFNKHVRPSIAPPVIAFLASLPSDRVEPDPGTTVPVLGIAVRLTDPRVAGQLDRIVKGVHFLLSASRLDLAKGLFGVRRVRRDGLVYHVADFGPMIQARIRDASLKRLANLPSSAGLTKLAYGRVGDFYLICSQEAFLDEWRAAQHDPLRRLAAEPSYAAFQLEPRPRLLASFLTRAPQLSALLRDVADYWKRAQETGAAPAAEPPKPADKPPGGEKQAEQRDPIEQPLRWVAEGLQHRRSFSLQLWRDDKKHLYGRLHVAPHE